MILMTMMMMVVMMMLLMMMLLMMMMMWLSSWSGLMRLGFGSAWLGLVWPGLLFLGAAGLLVLLGLGP